MNLFVFVHFVCSASLALTQGITRAFSRPAASPSLSREQVKQVLAGRRLSVGIDDLVEQVHISPGEEGEMVVIFVTKNRSVKSKVLFGEGERLDQHAVGRVRTYSTYICPSAHLWNPNMGEIPVKNTSLAALVNTSAFSPRGSSSYKVLENADAAWGALSEGCIKYNDPKAYWQSMYIHTVSLRGIKAGTRYKYKPAASTREFEFKSLPRAGQLNTEAPLRVGFIGDVGVTNVSSSTMQHLLDLNPDFLAIAGDYSYADGWSERWDTFGHLAEPLMSQVPNLGVPGNHEIEAGRYQGRDWEMRYPVPYKSDSPFWYSFNVGLIHMVGLAGSYAVTSPGSPQFEFLKEDLESVDRSQTPWVVVMFHTPWYSSSSNHHLEGFEAKKDMEHLLYENGVDLVVSGHVHAYERSHPVYNNSVDECAPAYIVLGDGGNYEGPALPWREPQPVWSAFREASFGAAMLTVHNTTHADWEWRRTACVHADGNTVSGSHNHYVWTDARGVNVECATSGDNSAQAYATVDFAMLRRDPKSCPNRANGRRLRASSEVMV